MRGSPLDHVFCETIAERYAEAGRLDSAQLVHNFAVEHGFEMAPVIRDSSDVVKMKAKPSVQPLADLETIHYYLSDFHGGVKAPYARVMIISAMNHFRANRDKVCKLNNHMCMGTALPRFMLIPLLITV